MMTCGECGNVTAPGAGFPNHVYCKRFLLHMEKREDASRCRDFIPKPITNADRIRAMTDAELAKTLCAMTDEGCPPWHDADISLCHNHGVCHDGECWLKWLKKEAAE